MNKVIIIQARMGSSRLPGKVLKPLGNSVVLDYVVTRCLEVKGIDEVVVATSSLKTDDVIAKWCKNNGVAYYRGPVDDVLARYYECAKEYRANYIVRVTADCPFLDYKLAGDLVGLVEKAKVDFYVIEGDLPLGLKVSMISFSSLEYIHNQGTEKRHREHVTYYANEYPEKFKYAYLKTDKEYHNPHLRLTLDTEEDYDLCKIVAKIFSNNKLVPSLKIINYLNDNQDIATLNAHVKQKPVI